MARLNDLLILGESTLLGDTSVLSKLTAHTITIGENEGATAALQFSRGSWNYITAPENGAIAFIANGQTLASTNVSLVIKHDSVTPGSTNGLIDLGQSNNGWKSVYATNFYGNFVGNATTSSYPLGFASSSTTNAGWGNQTGTTVVTWNDSTGGSVDWRRDNPSSGKISMKVDGRVYVNEGANPVLSSQKPVDGYWGICTPDGANNEWIRTTTQGLIPYTSGGSSSSLGTATWPFKDGYFQFLNVTNDDSNTGIDALAYFRHRSNNDWTVTIDTKDYDFGLQVINGHSAKDAFKVKGCARISNTLRIGSKDTTFASSWCEGIRIAAAASTWCTIALGVTGDTNTNENAWSIHRTNDNNFSIAHNESSGVTGMFISKNTSTTPSRVGFGTISPSYKLHVVGDIYADSGWFRVNGKRGLYLESYGTYIMYNDYGRYGGICIQGGGKGGYDGLHFGTSTSGMTVMSIASSHQGLYQESSQTWIIYNLNGAVSVGSSSPVSGYKVTLGGNSYVSGNIGVSGTVTIANEATLQYDATLKALKFVF